MCDRDKQWTALRNAVIALFREDGFDDYDMPTADEIATQAERGLDDPLELHDAIIDARETSEHDSKLDAEWRSEIANQAGMMGGCDAYNDTMGY